MRMKFGLILAILPLLFAGPILGQSSQAEQRSSPLSISAKLPKRMQQGTVTVWCVVDTHGKVRQARVERHLTKEADSAALRAVKGWKFEPAMKDGKPVSVQVLVDVLVKNTEP